MKYIIKYYRKEKGVWKYDVKLTTDFDLLINYLKVIERCSQYKLYAVTTDWEGTGAGGGTDGPGRPAHGRGSELEEEDK